MICAIMYPNQMNITIQNKYQQEEIKWNAILLQWK